jgi:molybdate transport system substrate-binding protein
VWNAVADKLAPAENVRAALAFVERGAAPLGIVYATDSRASAKVRVVGRFPPSAHPPISYPVALLARSSNPEAEAFRRFLGSARSKAIFRRHGFAVR